MSQTRKKRLALILALLLSAATTIGLVIYALNEHMDLFYTPSEVVFGKRNAGKPQVGQRLRVGGVVVNNSLVRSPDSLKVVFQIRDKGPAITVEYEGILPDLFREQQAIVAQGKLIEPFKVRAAEVLAKHDERYMPPDVAKTVGHWPSS
ncbi:MAG: cytochrome c maturation protein CcmE [Vibrionaceae bacterium]